MSYAFSSVTSDWLENTHFVEDILESDRGYARGPERSLMSAILFDGIQSYMNFVTSPGSRSNKRYQEAFAWVNKKDSEYVFSFDNVCEGLGIDPEFLRLGLINTCRSMGPERRKTRRTF